MALKAKRGLTAGELAQVAQAVRAKYLHGRRPTRLEDAYTVAYFLAKRLRRRFRDVRIMVGECATARGPVQHHWLEFPARDLYLDAAFDAFDPAQPVRTGKISEPGYAVAYPSAMDGQFDLRDPRDHPRMLYRRRQAWDAEKPD
jgi:hypothetical protein